MRHVTLYVYGRYIHDILLPASLLDLVVEDGHNDLLFLVIYYPSSDDITLFEKYQALRPRVFVLIIFSKRSRTSSGVRTMTSRGISRLGSDAILVTATCLSIGLS